MRCIMQTQTSSEILVTLEHVNLSLGSKKILTNISLTLYAKKVLTIIGPNGAGKSTLLRVLLGLQTINSGKVFRSSRLRIGYVPQKLAVNPLMPLSVRGFVSLVGEHQDSVDHDLFDAGVLPIADQAIQSVSGGEFQKVLLARALRRQPQLLVLDEPAQGIDIMGQGDFYEKIAALKEVRGFGVVMVSHDLHVVMQKTDQVLCLNEHICCSGLPEDVSQHPAYQRLFGILPDKGLAIYRHHHALQTKTSVVSQDLSCTTERCHGQKRCTHG